LVAHPAGGELRARNEIVVAVANATNAPGLAGTTAAVLAALGYTEPAAINAANQLASAVYAPSGLEAEAGRLAVDAGLTEGDIAPIDQLPALAEPNTFELVLVLGAESAPLDG
jgi:hypothetical protein